MSLAGCAALYWLLVRSPYPTAQAALDDFYGGGARPECMQAEPLRRHGAPVVPLLVRDLPTKTMPRRRYAIAFLGEGRFVEALPLLEAIALDESEKFYFRGDALEAIFAIEPSRARNLASKILLKPQAEDRFGDIERIVSSIRNETIQVHKHGCH